MNTASKKEALMTFMVKEGDRYNLAKSEIKFRETARSFIAKQEADENLITSTLEYLFNLHKGVTIGAKGLASMVIREMEKKNPAMGHHALYNTLSKRIYEVVHEDLGEGKTYGTRLGPAGGYYRNADQAPAAPAPPANVPLVMS